MHGGFKSRPESLCLIAFLVVIQSGVFWMAVNTNEAGCSSAGCSSVERACDSTVMRRWKTARAGDRFSNILHCTSPVGEHGSISADRTGVRHLPIHTADVSTEE